MPRTKKLTDYTYSPTNPASEDAIRSQIDDAIQEVYDDSARSAGTVNTTGDQTIADIKTFTSSPIVPTPTTANQASNKAYVDGVAISATIPLNSLTDEYLSSTPGNIKPRVATLETDFSTAQTDITNLQTATGLIETDIDIITTAVSDTGTVNNIAIATAGTFDLTKNKNVTPFIIPLFTNTNATVNIAIDGQANKLIKKANDTGTLVALEVGDIKKNVPIQLVWDSVNDFFIYAPKGGSNIKSIQRGITTIASGSTTRTITISSVDMTKSVLYLTFYGTTGDYKIARIQPNSNTEILITLSASVTATVNFAWQVVEYTNATVQRGVTTALTSAVSNVNVTITSIDLNKSFNHSTFSHSNGTDEFREYLTNSTTLSLYHGQFADKTVSWQVATFK